MCYETSMAEEQESLNMTHSRLGMIRTPALLSIKEGTSGGKTLETMLI